MINMIRLVRHHLIRFFLTKTNFRQNVLSVLIVTEVFTIDSQFPASLKGFCRH